MSEHSGGDLLNEWRAVMESMISSATSIAGRSDLSGDVLRATQRQLELMHELIERERALQGDLAARVMAPFDAVFDLLEQSAGALRRQAETLAAAGAALEESASLVQSQAELFERAVRTLRQPAELAKAVAGVDRKPRKPRAPRKG